MPVRPTDEKGVVTVRSPQYEQAMGARLHITWHVASMRLRKDIHHRT